MKNAVEKCRNCEDESDERSGGADVKEGARGANGRTQKNKRAEGSDERRERNEKRIAGANVMMTAGEKMAQFVSEKNRKERSGKGQAGEKRQLDSAHRQRRIACPPRGKCRESVETERWQERATCGMDEEQVARKRIR